jgi:hypothetical protein
VGSLLEVGRELVSTGVLCRKASSSIYLTRNSATSARDEPASPVAWIDQRAIGVWTSGPAETPSDWMTTPTSLSARFTVAVSSASPAIFSNLGWSTGIPSARADDEDRRHGFMLHGRTRLAHHHVQCRQPHGKIGERLERKISRRSPMSVLRAKGRTEILQCSGLLPYRVCYRR